MMALLYTLAMAVAIFCAVTALFDIANNGAANAYWAPYGLGIAVLLGVPAYIMVS